MTGDVATGDEATGDVATGDVATGDVATVTVFLIENTVAVGPIPGDTIDNVCYCSPYPRLVRDSTVRMFCRSHVGMGKKNGDVEIETSEGVETANTVAATWNPCAESLTYEPGTYPHGVVTLSPYCDEATLDDGDLATPLGDLATQGDLATLVGDVATSGDTTTQPGDVATTLGDTATLHGDLATALDDVATLATKLAAA